MKKLLQQALDGLVAEANLYKERDDNRAPDYLVEAIIALRAAIAQPESEPVGEVLPKWGGGHQVQLLGPVRVGDKLYKSSDREAELTARVAELEADAARYEWLFSARTESECSDEDVGLKPPRAQDLVVAELAGFYTHKAGVDAIVDAAMLQAAKESS